MLALVRRRIAREEMFADGGRIGVAVSGGADSVALLHALRQLYPNRPIAAVHLNHCLRGDASDGDERFVRKLAQRMDCDVLVRRVDVAARAQDSRESLESAGRSARYAFFADLRGSGECGVIATAHTRSDQAETVLFRVLRGSGGAGLAGILPTRRDGIVRPMLDVTRAEVLTYLRACSLKWREDSSNDDPAFARNRLRRQLLPMLRQDWNPGIESALANTAEWALEEGRFWDAEIAQLRPECVSETSDGTVLDVAKVRSLHPAVQRRLLHCALRDFGAAPGFVHVEALRALVVQPRGSGVAEVPGLRAERSFGAVLLRRLPVPDVPEYCLKLAVPGSVDLPVPGWGHLSTRVVDPQTGRGLYNQHKTTLLDWDRVPKPLQVRGWRPGDRLTLAGKLAPKKIGDLFQQHRVSAWLRPGWPVVAGGSGEGSVVWAGRFGLNDRFRVGPHSRRLLAIGISGPSGPKQASDASKELCGRTVAKD